MGVDLRDDTARVQMDSDEAKFDKVDEVKVVEEDYVDGVTELVVSLPSNTKIRLYPIRLGDTFNVIRHLLSEFQETVQYTNYSFHLMRVDHSKISEKTTKAVETNPKESFSLQGREGPANSAIKDNINVCNQGIIEKL